MDKFNNIESFPKNERLTIKHVVALLKLLPDCKESSKESNNFYKALKGMSLIGEWHPHLFKHYKEIHKLIEKLLEEK